MPNMSEQCIIDYYKKIASSTNTLKKQEEMDLLKKCINKNCQTSKHKLINSYLKVVVSLANKYSEFNNFSQADLIHAGIVGIQNALNKFDLSKYKKINTNTGSLFSYYCYRAILMEFKDYYRNNIRQFSVSDTSNTRLNNITKLYKSGRLDSLNDYEIENLISKEFKLRKREVRLLLNLLKPPAELDKQLSHDNDRSFSIGEVISMSDELSPIEQLEIKEQHKNLLDSINELDEKERSIIYHRYGINCKKYTLAQLSKKYNMSVAGLINKINRIQDKLKKIMKAKI